MSHRKTTAGRSAFYRGISLKEYLRRSSQLDEQLNYKDDQTIFYDQNHLPVVVGDDFILSEKRTDLHFFQENLSARMPSQNDEASMGGFPILNRKKQGQSKLKSFLTDRHSTDASLPNGCEVRQRCLPSLDPNQPIEQTSRMASQLSQSRNSIRIRRPSPIARQKSDVSNNQPAPNPARSISNRKYVELIRQEIQMKQRYNIGDVRCAVQAGRNSKYFQRVKSHNE